MSCWCKCRAKQCLVKGTAEWQWHPEHAGDRADVSSRRHSRARNVDQALEQMAPGATAWVSVWIGWIKTSSEKGQSWDCLRVSVGLSVLLLQGEVLHECSCCGGQCMKWDSFASFNGKRHFISWRSLFLLPPTSSLCVIQTGFQMGGRKETHNYWLALPKFE